MTFDQFKPTVPKCWLFATCGLMWSGVGVMMCRAGIGWLTPLATMRMAGIEVTGAALAVVAFFLGFRTIARKNILRLRQLPERGCFFAFQAWKSYLIVAFMIALGITLRHSSIPKIYLAIVYTTIGGALFMGSILYYRVLFRLMRSEKRRR